MRVSKMMVVIGLIPAFIVSMNSNQMRTPQFEICPARKEYIAKKNENNAQEKPICFFCDENNMKTNKIVDENKKINVRIMMNKSPYFSFDQGFHVLFMPI